MTTITQTRSRISARLDRLVRDIKLAITTRRELERQIDDAVATADEMLTLVNDHARARRELQQTLDVATENLRRTTQELVEQQREIYTLRQRVAQQGVALSTSSVHRSREAG